ncbi:3-isopropylmalate dehydratase small subunit [candidate division WOR-3 bacterium]|jgi:3-isopropylmalate/(R)-2-methylmalate dehydratase small subunit|nr:3-isopropylmalate dehydratase small subunit [candidate division WOR-3 bacterium]
MLIRGKVYKFASNINTDVIYPGKYLSITTDREEMAKHCFEAAYPEFLENAKKGDIIVSGKNFGCGSSREQAATCLKYFGIGAVVAESFARIFYRNAINLALPVIIAPGISQKIEHNDTIEINLETGIIKNMRTAEIIKANRLPPFILKIINDGGLIPYLKKKLKNSNIIRRIQ